MTDADAATILLGPPDRPPYGPEIVVRVPPEGIALKEIDRQAVQQALDLAHGVQKDAAQLLHLTPRVFTYKLKKLGIPI